jgi:hypothetical protein
MQYVRLAPLLLLASSAGCIDWAGLSRDYGGATELGGLSDLSAPADGGMALAYCAANPGLLLCEDFESGSIDPTRWLKTESAATATVDSRNARGRFALHLSVGGDPAAMAFQATVSEQAPITLPAEFYVRVWLYAPASTLALEFLRLNYSNGLAHSSLWLLTNGLAMLYDTSADSANSMNAIDLGRWNCTTWHVGSSLGLEAQLNGGGVFRLPQTQSYHGVQLGAENTGTGAGFTQFELWLDELAVSTSPLPCP